MSAAVPLALYVHMPWCVRKCPYCDFNSHQLKSGRPDPGYVHSLLEDFDRDAPLIAGRRIDTIFFGGGTPSLFAPDQIAAFLRGVRQRAELAADAEITLEANPGTIECGRFDGYAQAGVNRVSLGAQSFDAPALERLGRIHTPEDTLRAVGELRAAGLHNFNLDLMYALPQQSAAAAALDVTTACALQPAHISYYQLTLEPGTVFHARPPPLPDEEAAWEIQREGQRLLANAGYAQYEVSAYARPGARCRHNLNYWLFGDYVGIGAGAHGKISLELPGRILRTVKPKMPGDYQQSLAGAAGPCGERQPIDVAQLPFEFMLNALRLNEGFTYREFADRTGLDAAVAEPRIAAAAERGLLEASPSGWRPTALGHRFLNDLQAGFLV